MANEVTLYQVNNAVSDSYTTYDAVGQTTYSKAAAAFEVVVAGTVLVGVESRLDRIGTPTDGVVCKLYSHDSTNLEPGTLLATSDTIDPDSYALSTWTFDGSYVLQKDTIYWVVFERTGTLNNSNSWRIAYASAASQVLTDQALKYNEVSGWETSGSGRIYYVNIKAESNSLEELVNYSYEYDALYNFAEDTTEWGITAKFKTPTNASGNSYAISLAALGSGGYTSPYGCNSGDCNIYCEFHIGSAATLDLAESSTTRIGQRSNGVGRDLMNTSYQTTETQFWTWNINNRPLLQQNTEYWIVFLPLNAGDGGGWRIGQDNTDPKGDGYTNYRVSSAGVLTSTGANEVWTNMFVLGAQQVRIGLDIILPWNLNPPITQVNSDTIIKWLLIMDLGKDFILPWNIQEEWLWELKWNLSLDVGSDTILRWNILHEAQKDIIFRWGILVEQDWIIPWVLRPLISQDWILKYGIFMASDNILKWGMNTMVTNDHVFRWIIDSRVWQDVALKYHIKVETDHVILIPLRQQIDNDIILSHHMLANVASDQVIRFNIREFNQIDADKKLRWVLQGKPRIYKITFE